MEFLIKKCYICGYLIEANIKKWFTRVFNVHILNEHGLSEQEYCDLFINDGIIDKCRNIGCLANTRWIHHLKTYGKYCSLSCTTSHRNKIRWKDINYREKMLKSIYKWDDEEYRAKMKLVQSETIKKTWESKREHMLSVFATRKYTRTEEQMKALSCLTTKRNYDIWNDPEKREKQIATFSKRILSEETLYRKSKTISNKALDRWRNLDFRNKMYDILKNNPRFGRYKTNKNVIYKCNTIMRSSWEKKFAEDLDRLNVDWNYENKVFTMDNGRRYTPDFYLPEIDLFVEIKPKKFVNDCDVSYKFNQVIKRRKNIIFCTKETWKVVLNNILTIKEKRIGE